MKALTVFSTDPRIWENFYSLSFPLLLWDSDVLLNFNFLKSCFINPLDCMLRFPLPPPLHLGQPVPKEKVIWAVKPLTWCLLKSAFCILLCQDCN